MKDKLAIATMMFIGLTVLLCFVFLPFIPNTSLRSSFGIYHFQGNVVLTVDDIKYLQDKYNNYVIGFSDNKDWVIDNVNEIPVSYSFNNISATELNGKLIGSMKWSNIIALLILVVVWGISGYTCIKYFPNHVRMWRHDKEIREHRLAEIYPVLSNHLLDKDKSIVIDKIPSPSNYNIEGIIGYREWRINKGTYKLNSLFVSGGKSWKLPIAISNHQPSPKNDYGLYSKILVADSNGTSIINLRSRTITGITESRGTIIEHEDGVLRADCCRILFFILNKYEFPDYAEGLSKQYHVPVVETSADYIVLENWPAVMKVHKC